VVPVAFDLVVPCMLKQEPKFKIIVAGEGGVGKTTFVTRCTVGEYIAEDYITIGANFAVKKFRYGDNDFSFQIWDFAGEERFRFILPAFCRGASAGFVCFDFTRPSTLEALPSWIGMIRKHAGDIPLLLVGFKVDMLDGGRTMMMPCVELEFAKKFARAHNLVGFIPISSKEDENISQAFLILSDSLCKRRVGKVEV